MPHTDCGVFCKIGYLQDLRQAPNLLQQKRPVCTLLHSLLDAPESIPDWGLQICWHPCRVRPY